MIQLSTDLSDPLLELIDRGEAPIDAVEVGPWFSVRRVRAYRQALYPLPFTFHGGDLIERVGWVPGILHRIQAYQRWCGGPWVSMHSTMWLPGQVWLMLRWGWRMPRPNPDRASERLIWQVKRLAGAVGVPVILENMPALPFTGYDFETEPARIRQVLEQTGCGLLLDTGHACIAAAARGMGVGEYVGCLPLERVVQVHASGPRMREGCLVDAHEPLREADWVLLESVLAQTQPQMVTLEYIRERDALSDQLARLRDLVDAFNRRRG
jgi:sugar phosphate isomerase/epimerase